MDDDLRYLRDMKSRIARIRQYTRDGRRALIGSDLLQDAVVRNIELIGYTWTCLSPEYRLRLPDFPWRLIGTRSEYLKHTHDPERLKKLVWLAVRRSVPELERAIRKQFPDLDGDSVQDPPPPSEARASARSGPKRGVRAAERAATAEEDVVGREA
ncbi:hypothetical protein FCJ61_10125 [Burkholderia metallica]|uniref:HepT-like ribonuclease domain-containing protein n=1 Tax=Burkholderia metallica TaxID=488729 RepID=UPI00157A45C1|nr:hypothetical protein [Burkholderia metallica]NTZ83343.1 hypothetical protein [Burkholderia metallica]